MAKSDLNKHLDDYLANKRSGKRSFRFRVKVKKGGEEKVPDIRAKKVHAIYKRPGFWDRLFSRKEQIDMLEKEQAEEAKIHRMSQELEMTEEQIRELKREAAELENKRDNIFSRLFKMFKRSEQDKEELLEDMPVVEERTLDPETVQVLKISSKWISRLSSENRQAFKESEDYKKYKAFLDKYGLTKK